MYTVQSSIIVLVSYISVKKNTELCDQFIDSTTFYYNAIGQLHWPPAPIVKNLFNIVTTDAYVSGTDIRQSAIGDLGPGMRGH